MKAFGAFVVLMAGALTATAAMAAEPPDLVGTWKPTGDFAGVAAGDGTEHMPGSATPVFRTPDAAWSVVITEQKGRAFHGKTVSPKGTQDTMVGVVRANGTSIILADGQGGMFGEVAGGEMELCFQDHDEDRAVVACMMLAKE